MGLDLDIYIKVKEGESLDIPYAPYPVEKDAFGFVRERCPPESTHSVDVGCWRYWSPDYRRGPFPDICKLLLECFADTAIERIWYANDGGHYEEMTSERLCEFVRAFCNPPFKRD